MGAATAALCPRRTCRSSRTAAGWPRWPKQVLRALPGVSKTVTAGRLSRRHGDHCSGNAGLPAPSSQRCRQAFRPGRLSGRATRSLEAPGHAASRSDQPIEGLGCRQGGRRPHWARRNHVVIKFSASRGRNMAQGSFQSWGLILERPPQPRQAQVEPVPPVSNRENQQGDGRQSRNAPGRQGRPALAGNLSRESLGGPQARSSQGTTDADQTGRTQSLTRRCSRLALQLLNGSSRPNQLPHKASEQFPGQGPNQERSGPGRCSAARRCAADRRGWRPGQGQANPGGPMAVSAQVLRAGGRGATFERNRWSSDTPSPLPPDSRQWRELKSAITSAPKRGARAPGAGPESRNKSS